MNKVNNINNAIENIIDLINEHTINRIKFSELIKGMNAVDIAESFEELSKDKVVQVYRLLPKDMAADVFTCLEKEHQKIIIDALADGEVGKVVEELFVDDAVDFIEEMPANVVKRVLQNVSEDKRKTINQLLQYPEESAGAIMTTEYVDLKEDVTVSYAFEDIRNTGVDKETIYTCYVIRNDRILVGVITVKTLLLASPCDRIGDIMDSNVISAHTTDDQEAVAELFKKYGLLSLPVVDNENRLVGIVTVDDIIEVMEEEATEDIEKMAALKPSEEPYMKTNAFQLSKNRIPWLMVLMISATLTATILDGFQNALASVPLLMLFFPMLMDTAGNAGAQTSALVIRGMAVGEIRMKDVLKVFWREIQVALICGCVMSVVNFARVYFMHGRDFMLSLTVSLALVMTLIIAKSLGCLLPIAARALKIDPAVMAAPLITTIADAASLILYFSIAKVILQI